MKRTDGGWLARVVRFSLEEKLLVVLGVVAILIAGVAYAPFRWSGGPIPRDPIPVDALPDLGENQQIVYTRWEGRSPQDVEDQVSYPLTVALLGVPGVRTVRSVSMFGFSTVYVLFEEDVEFYWSRSRVLEKLASLSANTLPAGVQPTLGPDATPLGQVYWYTLEGLDPDGEPVGGWSLAELRSLQDWVVRYALASAEGVAEIASVGGFVQEYQIDVDPDAMRAHGVSLQEVFQAVRNSNLDVGARTIEVNRVEYLVRGLGLVESLEDLEETVVRAADNVPIRIGDVAEVVRGPALRRGALDRAGAEAVGGVVVTRYGANPLQVIENVEREIERLSPGLPLRVLVDARNVRRAELEAFAASQGFQAFSPADAVEIDQAAWTAWATRVGRDAWPDWLTTSKVTIEPFYDRTGLIEETLDTLSAALVNELLITVLVVVLLLSHLRGSLLIGALLPLAIAVSFVAMRWFGVEANIVALSGIAIAIGTMVDVGVVVSENIVKRLQEADAEESRLEVIHRATLEVGGAVATSVATTVISFLPVFVMSGAEGKLFRPLAFTKTFALLASVVLTLTVLPAAAHALFGRPAAPKSRGRSLVVYGAVAALGLVLLARHWKPLGTGAPPWQQLVFAALTVVPLLLLFSLVQRAYPRVLAWCLGNKLATLSIPALAVLSGLCAWLGFERVFSFVPRVASSVGLDEQEVRSASLWNVGSDLFPGLGREFMPPLDEGSFLWMPSTMAHASIGEALDVLQTQDAAIAAVPEVRQVVGKIGRVDSALDPAPIGMIETVVNLHPEWGVDEDGEPVRLWRDHVRTPDDVWEEIVRAARLPGTTSAPKLQPIAARLVMLSSGLRAPMGIQVRGPDLETIERFGLELEALLKEVPGVEPSAVLADRIVGKPYLEIDLDRSALARHGLSVASVQEVIEVAVGGKPLTTTIEGRERYPVRVRYARELRDGPGDLGSILVPTPGGAQIPLAQLAEVRYVRGPQAIRSEDTFLTGTVVFDKRDGFAEVDVVQAAERAVTDAITAGRLRVPSGVSHAFIGTWEHQVHAQRTLAFVVPVALALVFVLLYLHFRSSVTTLIVWSGVVVAWSGGFLLLWLCGHAGFLDLEVFGTPLRALLQLEETNLSVAVWVGFLALFGIATDDGVVMSTYLDQSLAARTPRTVAEVRAAVVAAGSRRVRPCLMTTATTLLALLPVLTSRGRGSDVMVPMAIPTVGGMTLALVTMLVVPVLYSAVQERRLCR